MTHRLSFQPWHAVSACLAVFLLTLSGCDAMSADEPTDSTSFVQASAGGTEGVRPVLTGATQIWLRAPEEEVEQRINDTRALGLDAFAVGDRIDMLIGESPMDAGERMILSARNAGLDVWFAPHEYDRTILEATPLEDFRAGGQAWGTLACRYLDTVRGFSVQNEYDLAVGRQNTLSQAEETAELHARVIRAFAQGVKEACPAVPVFAGPVAKPHRNSAAYALSFLAADLAQGILDGIGVNIYNQCIDFRLDDDGEGLRLRKPIAYTLAEMLNKAGLPSNTLIGISETNVQRPTCSSDEETAEALAGQLEEISADPRIVRVFVYSPWPPAGPSSEDYTIRPGTPVGNAVRAWATSIPTP
jgi:hypothetical protein